MKLLEDLPFDGYPTEYLLARLHGDSIPGYRARPAETNAEPAEEALWRNSQKVLTWLYRQANPELRQPLTPVFTLLEFRTLILCLRHKASRAIDPVENLLTFSLLSSSLKGILRADEDLPTSIAAVSTWLAHRSKTFTGIQTAHAEDGLRGFEEDLYYRYLRHSLNSRHPPAIQEVLTHFVDLRNLLALYKKLRWQLTASCSFLAGGCLSIAGLQSIEQTGRLQAMEPLSGSFAGSRKISTAEIETALTGKLSRDLHRYQRVGDPFGAVLAFLWRHFIRTRNTGLRELCSDLDPSILEAELIG